MKSSLPYMVGAVFVASAVASACGSEEGQHIEGREPNHSVRYQLALIGANGERPGHLLHRVRGAFRAEDGSIVVANSGSSTIRVFDAEGRLKLEMGGAGAGPAEFQSLQALLPHGTDSLIAWDPLINRLSIWSLNGELGRTIRLPLGFVPKLHGRLEDGRYVLAAEKRILPSTRAPWQIYRDSLRIALADPAAEEVEYITVEPNRKMVAAVPPGGGRHIGNPIPSSVNLLVQSRGNDIVIGDPEASEIRVINAAGNVVETVKLQITPKARTRTHVNQWIESLVARAESKERPALRTYLEQFPQPHNYPTFDRLLVDDGGVIWVRLFVTPDDTVALLARLAKDGSVEHEIKIPLHFDPAQVGNNWILGTSKGEDDEELVALYSWD